ncbi:hypothetical protein UFOVP328_84 [uncultured Caudovirales phage]|uniref:Uncharacterized protein n=1 Tax=uncultured Caudovirales phage TaxID=2100421 RepID=A0A6J5LXJ2_9CAUD|nr:hypothetical protein UFOVP328_84 [uncultured Caudovirales phage]
MSLTNLILLDTTTVGTPSGNYDGSSTDFVSDAQKGVGYYRGQGSLQTVVFNIAGVQGTFTLQATLDEDPETLNWVDVYTYENPTPTTDYHPTNILGNFVWIRVAVTGFVAGTINAVNLSY